MRALLTTLLVVTLCHVTHAQPDSLRSTPIEPQDKPRIQLGRGVLWLGPTYKHDWGFEGGVRYDWLGVALGFPSVHHGEAGPGDVSIIDDDVPDADFTTIAYDWGYLGVVAVGFYDIVPSVAMYGGLGVYWKTKRYVDRSGATGYYYRNNTTSTWHDGEPAFIIGSQLTLFQHLVLGVGYNTVAGVGAFIGFR